MQKILDQLVTEYLAAVAALIARNPIQERNRERYIAWAASAKLGITTRRIRTKLRDIPAGTFVLFTPDEMGAQIGRDAVEVWALNKDETRTIVDPDVVREVCSTCGGSDQVYPHPTALVAIACPSC